MTKNLIVEIYGRPWDDPDVRRLKVTDLTISSGEKLGFITWDRVLSIMVEKYGFNESSFSSALNLLKGFITPLNFVWRTEREIFQKIPHISQSERSMLEKCIPDIELVLLRECFPQSIVDSIVRGILTWKRAKESHKQVIAPGTKKLRESNL